jgi:hypothetical protein
MVVVIGGGIRSSVVFGRASSGVEQAALVEERRPYVPRRRNRLELT